MPQVLSQLQFVTHQIWHGEGSGFPGNRRQVAPIRLWGNISKGEQDFGAAC